MKRKILSVALTLAMASCVLGGCSGNVTKTSSVKETNSVNESQTKTSSVSQQSSTSKTSSEGKEVLKFCSSYERNISEVCRHAR